MEHGRATETPTGNKPTGVLVSPDDLVDAGTPPRIKEAITDIGNYEYDPWDTTGTKTPSADEVLMMFSPQAVATELPKLTTEKWPWAVTKKPTPITIGTARRFLAEAYSRVPCEMEAAGDHGYAWMIEEPVDWARREGTKEIEQLPTKPKRPTEYTVQAKWEYAERKRDYDMYHHLVQEGKAKIIEWFGKALFVDLYQNGLLPVTKTPRELLQHLTDTYALPRDRRRHLEEVDKEFNAPYDPKGTVEAYFMKLQDAETHAALLGQPYTSQQIINKALKQFEIHYEKDAYKAEKKWNEKDSKDQTWENFKTYWKDEIHQWETAYGGKKAEANNAIDINSLVESISALQAENRSLQDEQAQLKFQQALQAEQMRDTSDDSVSTITAYIEDLERRRAAQERSQDTSGQSDRTRELIAIARNRNPADYKNLNGGKGKQFSSYCWKCGCNTTHWTKRCFDLSFSDRKKYKDADFDNQMGGSCKFIDRRGKYQSDFGFDSL